MSSNNDNTSGARSFSNWIELFAETVSTAFPVWVALGCLLGRIKPSSFIWVRPKLTVLGITLTMLGMGMTLTLDDLRGALAMPKELTCGFLLQYSEQQGNMSQQMRLESRSLNTSAILCGNTIEQSAFAILMSGQQAVLAASLLHASGFFFGYVLFRMLGLDVSWSRTVSIDVGMQNSVLEVVSASQHFGNPLTALPCAVSSVCHSIFGSILAGIWRRMPTQMQD